MSASPLQRIKKVMKFYYDRGQNKESVNTVYRKIIKKKHQKEVLKDIINFDEKIGLYNY